MVGGGALHRPSGDAVSHGESVVVGLFSTFLWEGRGAAAGRGSALIFHPLEGVIVGQATMQVEQTAAGRPAPLIPHQIDVIDVYTIHDTSSLFYTQAM